MYIKKLHIGWFQLYDILKKRQNCGNSTKTSRYKGFYGKVKGRKGMFKVVKLFYLWSYNGGYVPFYVCQNPKNVKMYQVNPNKS